MAGEKIRAPMTSKNMAQYIDLESLKEIWMFMAESNFQAKEHADKLKDFDHKFELIKEALDKKCSNCPFSVEKEEFSKLKKDNIKIMAIGGVILFIISTFIAPILVRLIVK